MKFLYDSDDCGMIHTAMQNENIKDPYCIVLSCPMC